MSNATTFRFPDNTTRSLIDTAAQLVGMTRTAFMLAVSKEKAKKVIREHAAETEPLRLSAAASVDIAAALANPRPASPALKKLMKQYRTFTRKKCHSAN
ncbi:hypothetical protein FACS1894107_10790 [Planctomycetales bacterium]|nr:hypothetical protein FACS1894107_10790 [Planctomycetales bacterium]GHS99581.1 hypothetical protein FACS1894108_09850 [Planctomycetales bacterium]